MIPTPEQIAAMKARGWTYDANARAFGCAMNLEGDENVFILRVRRMSIGGWIAMYGVPGHSYSTFTAHPDPLLAADEAEGWLRAELSHLTFPWLRPDTGTHDRIESALSAALGHPTVERAPTLEDLIAMVAQMAKGQAPPVQQEDGTLWRVLDGVTYLSADEGLNWQRVPSCGFEGCTRPAVMVDTEGVGFCEPCAAKWLVLDRHHILHRPFDPEWRRGQVALDHGGALAEAWAAALATGTVPDQEPLDTRWPGELRQEIDALQGHLEDARDIARRYKMGDAIMPWEYQDWMDEETGDEDVEDPS